MRNPLQDGAVIHPGNYRRRRFLNWAALGATYAFLYMGRYNLTVAKGALGDLMTLEQFGDIFGVGTAVYAFSFLFNGPLTDRVGGRFAILMAACGASVANVLMGAYTYHYVTQGAGLFGIDLNPTMVFAVLYALNMYFQSFGAVAIVKVNSNWFHVRERGTFSAIFGAIISSGIFLAFDVGYRIVKFSEGRGPGGIDATWWVFWVPAIALAIFFVIDLFTVRNHPSDAGQDDIQTGAAVLSEDEDKPIPTLTLLKTILTNPIIMTVACIEFCTGILRNGVMHWYPLYADSALVLQGSHFMRANWGLILFVAGVAGGTFAGLVSDKLFQSRRAPAAGGLYAGLVVAVGAMIFFVKGTEAKVGWLKDPVQEARALGLEAGDLIVSLDGSQIDTRAHFIATLEKYGRHEIEVLARPVGTSGAEIGSKGAKLTALTVRGVRKKIVIQTDAALLKKLRLRKRLVAIPKEYHRRKGEVVHLPQAALFWKGAWAAEVGLQKGDALLSVNGEVPKDWEAFLVALKLDGTPNQVRIARGGAERTLAIAYPPTGPAQNKQRAKFAAAGPVQKLNPFLLGGIAFFVSMCVIGTHGLLSGTATMDFGGKRGTATTVGVIDGFVYLGTAVQSFSLGRITSWNWAYWPVFLLPFALIGFYLCTRIWHVTPKGRGGH